MEDHIHISSAPETTPVHQLEETRLSELSLGVRSYTPKEILNSPFDLKWIVPNLVQCPGLLMCVGPSKIGKSTFLVKASLSISKGESFLGEKSIQGKVLYVALEGGIGSAKLVLTQMGLKESDDLVLIVDKPDNKLLASENLDRFIDYHKPDFVVLDSLMLWEKSFNENAYSETYDVLRRYTKIAKERNVSIIFTHHSPKSALEGSGGGDGALGSTAFFGAVDTKIQLMRIYGIPHVKVDHRNEKSYEPRPIFIDRDTGTVSLTKPVLSPAEFRIREEIITLFDMRTGAIKDAEIKKSVRGKNESKIKVLEHLCEEGILIRNDEKPLSYIYDQAADREYTNFFDFLNDDELDLLQRGVQTLTNEEHNELIVSQYENNSLFPVLAPGKEGIEV